MPSLLPEIQVLLATYNGERFLREQIDSILAQTYPNLRILARDDGSRDSTPAILRDYAARFPHRFALLPDSTPTGSAQMNFKQLLLASTAPYVAFSDQDDVWLPHKLELSIHAMRDLEARTPPGKPLLIFTDLRVVDEQLHTRGDSFWQMEHLKPSSISKLRRLLPRNVVTGCTALLNRELAQLASQMPSDVLHDSWAALLATTFGAAAFVKQATVLYRQHTSNVVGAEVQPRALDVPRLKNHSSRNRLWIDRQLHARLLLRNFAGSLLPEDARILREFMLCDSLPNRPSRMLCMVRNRFFFSYPRLTVAMLWFLWDRPSTPRIS